MSDVSRLLDLGAIDKAVAESYAQAQHTGLALTIAEQHRARLVEEVKRLREALDGLVKINAEDFPAGPDGRIDWNAFPVTFSYAKAYRAALVALGREAA